MIQGAAYDQLMKFVDGAEDGAGNPYNVTAYNSARHVPGVSETGTNLNDKVKNIFDLQGNVSTYTTEFNRDFKLRGAGDSYECCSSHRFEYDAWTVAYCLYSGTLIQLYIK